MKERDRQTGSETDRLTDRQRGGGEAFVHIIKRNNNTHTHTHTHTHTERERERESDRQTDRKRERGGGHLFI